MAQWTWFESAAVGLACVAAATSALAPSPPNNDDPWLWDSPKLVAEKTDGTSIELPPKNGKPTLILFSEIGSPSFRDVLSAFFDLTEKRSSEINISLVMLLAGLDAAQNTMILQQPNVYKDSKTEPARRVFYAAPVRYYLFGKDGVLRAKSKRGLQKFDRKDLDLKLSELASDL